MVITFVSNFLNHHQLFLCNDFIELCDEFYFIATEEIPEKTRKFGYEDMNNNAFVIKAYENEEQNQKSIEKILTSDIVIFGSCPDEFIRLRMEKNKLSFLFTERFFKKGLWRRFIPPTRKKVINRIVKYKKNELYVLCASGYVSFDLHMCGFNGKCIKWGYFPEVKKQDIHQLMLNKKNNKTKLLWAGRFIDWKNTKDALEVAKRLKSDGYSFEMEVIGNGDCEEEIKSLLKKYNLSDCVFLLGSMAPEKVRGYMEKANIYLFTSSFQEGWGAVLNESMNSGCAVVASHAIGSVPYLIQNGKNGLIYKYGDNNDLYNKVKYLLENPEKQQEFGIGAYHTLLYTWNSNVASKRLINISQQLLAGQALKLYEEGPCSNAEIITNNWFIGENN